MSGEPDEADAVRGRYARRLPADPRYALSNPAALAAMQERQRGVVALLRNEGHADFASLELLEVGSGHGSNLLELLWLGFVPEKLSGIELLPERHAAARSRLPAAVRLMLGDATQVAVTAASADIVLASTVFSSLLDDAFQQRLADAMWRAVRPGGGVLWYDFTVNNPRNADVRGVPWQRVRTLFPHATTVRHQRVTLAPPIARAVTRLHPALYTAFNALAPLRTHLIAWLGKAA